MTRKTAVDAIRLGLAAALIVGAFALLAAHVFASGGPVARGRAIVNGVRPACRACHTSKSLPLSRFAEKGGARQDIRDWIRDPEMMFERAGKHGKMPAYSRKKISDDELEAVVEYIFAGTP